MTEAAETTVWRGSPSQVSNLGVYLLCLLGSPLVVPIFVALWKYLGLKSSVYELTTERLRMSSGVLGRKTDELELYRVKDGAIVEPFGLRIFGLGSVILTTSDRTHPEVVIPAVKEPRAVWDKLRAGVETARRRMGARELDVS